MSTVRWWFVHVEHQSGMKLIQRLINENSENDNNDMLVPKGEFSGKKPPPYKG